MYMIVHVPNGLSSALSFTKGSMGMAEDLLGQFKNPPEHLKTGYRLP